MGKADVQPEYRYRPRTVLGAVFATAGVFILGGCSREQLSTGYLPTQRGTTDKVDMMIDLWNGSWIAAMLVGILVWGLIIWSMIAYRRRRATDPLPPQTQYNVPLEVLYTVVPVVMIAVMFVFTARYQDEIERRVDRPDLKVQVIAKQWSWDFNYRTAGVFETGQQTRLSNSADAESKIPTLFLPVDKNVEIQINSRDVAHSFWIPEFLYKKDAIPGHTNYMTVRPQREGVFKGLCAELCGEYHSEMLFKVEVVSQDRYEKEMQNLRQKGQTGELSLDLSRQGAGPAANNPSTNGGRG